MKTITQRELTARSKAVLDDVEAGETYHITRNGTEIAEVRPLSARRRFVPVDELQRKWRHAPKVDAAGMRAEADEFFGADDLISDDDNPWERG
ncbi:antitoxin (DNA-binding transcriptional repressor) of toxin-antitoxin stability system [Kitasatospora sp. MAP12-15]|uniref:type II toxin-antitoxin system Phd/YefM family antitoxin n=1 Tax=unclassified Kitasatospora TaxID=2633591 RepID=UPI0024736DA1|nr:PhdYeFM domain-containing protein [Kitasatospora sp. MAP12-44]MDH6109962.1 antitoxin (DNA-binding transcriptional repressor) of toxin-antitoxin stability system [Kitasatospora sp. MAP12-44]